jgi:hypothetical protein
MTLRTGATLGNFDVLERIEPLRRERHTYCVTEHVDNPSLREAMSFFDESLVAPMQPYLLFLSCCVGPVPLAVITGSAGAGKSALVVEFISAFEHPPVRSDVVVPTVLHLAVHGVLDTRLAARAVGSFVGTALGSVGGSTWILAGQLQENVRSLEPVSETSTHKFDDVVDVVRDLQHRLGIDLKDVLAAASIKPRTYHSWARPSAPRPRLTSQGRLWALAQLVDDLPELLDVPIRQWVLADSERLTALRAGRFDELLEQASQERMQKDPTGTVAGPFHGVGEDDPPSLRITSHELVVDEQAITEPALPPRRPPELPQT